MPAIRLPNFDGLKKYGVVGDLLNKICRELERLGRISVAQPLCVHQDDGTGIILGCDIPVIPPNYPIVTLTKDGGNDGDAESGQEATWTYTVNDVNTGQNYAVQLPAYGHRQQAQQTVSGSLGMLFKVTNPANIGYGGNQDITINGGNGYGYTGSGSGSGAGSGSTDQPYRLVIFDEQFPMNPCNQTSGSGSTNG